MRVSVSSYQLKLRDPFTIARGTVKVQPTLIVRLEHDGLVGLGEATTNEFYGVTLESMSAAIERVAARLVDWQLENPAELWRELDPLLKDCRFAPVCARLCSLGFVRQVQGEPLWRLWGLRDDDGFPPTCYTIGLDTPEEMVRRCVPCPIGRSTRLSSTRVEGWIWCGVCGARRRACSALMRIVLGGPLMCQAGQRNWLSYKWS